MGGGAKGLHYGAGPPYGMKQKAHWHHNSTKSAKMTPMMHVSVILEFILLKSSLLVSFACG